MDVDIFIEAYDSGNRDMQSFTANLDEHGQVFHAELPKFGDFETFRCNRSIIDDLTGKPIKYE